MLKARIVHKFAYVLLCVSLQLFLSVVESWKPGITVYSFVHGVLFCNESWHFNNIKDDFYYGQ